MTSITRNCLMLPNPGMQSTIFAYPCLFTHHSEVVKQELEHILEVCQLTAAVTIQSWVRRWICRKRWPNLKRSLEMQKKGRHGSRVHHK